MFWDIFVKNQKRIVMILLNSDASRVKTAKKRLFFAFAKTPSPA